MMNAAVKCSYRMCRQGALSVPLLLSLALAGCAHSLEPIGPEGIIGERARVQFDAGRSYEGILRNLDDDVATLETEGETLRPIPLSPTARLEIARGTKSNTGRGAGLGALIGGAGFGVVGLVDCEDDFLFSRGDCVLISTLVGAGSGALVGLIVGSMSKSQRWVEVDRTRRPVKVVRPRHGLGGHHGVQDRFFGRLDRRAEEGVDPIVGDHLEGGRTVMRVSGARVE